MGMHTSVFVFLVVNKCMVWKFMSQKSSQATSASHTPQNVSVSGKQFQCLSLLISPTAFCFLGPLVDLHLYSNHSWWLSGSLNCFSFAQFNSSAIKKLISCCFDLYYTNSSFIFLTPAICYACSFSVNPLYL